MVSLQHLLLVLCWCVSVTIPTDGIQYDGSVAASSAADGVDRWSATAWRRSTEDDLVIPIRAAANYLVTSSRDRRDHDHLGAGAPGTGVIASEACRLSMTAYKNNKYPRAADLKATNSPKIMSSGDYQQCDQIHDADAHFCTVAWNVADHPQPLPNATSSAQLFAQFCLPRNCTSRDMMDPAIIFDLFPIDWILYEIIMIPESQELRCMDAQPSVTEFSGAVIMIIISASFVGVTLMATSADYIINHDYLSSVYHSKKRQSLIAASPASTSNGVLDSPEVRLSHVADDFKKPIGGPGVSEDIRNDVNHRSGCTRFCSSLMSSFSIIRNYPKLIHHPPTGAVDLNSLNGIRVISMCWVIMGHTIQIGNSLTTSWGYIYGEVITRSSMSIVIQALFSVDTFFFLSGLLAAYLLLVELRKKGHINWMMYYAHRFLRLTPIYMFWLFFYWKLQPHIGRGPWWFLMEGAANPGCEKYWWTNLLYINNFKPNDFDGQCMAWTWYLANDMQFAVILPIFVWLYYKNKRAGWLLLWVTLIASFITTGVIVHDHKYSANLFTANSQQTDVYEKPYCRIGPYLVGVGLAFLFDQWFGTVPKKQQSVSDINNGNTDGGYIIRHQHGQYQRLPGVDAANGGLCVMCRSTSPSPSPGQRRCYVISVWIIAAFIMLTLLYAPWDMVKHGMSSDYDWPLAVNVLWITYTKFLWGIALSLLVSMFALGYGGGIRSFLSHPIFTPLARLSYQAYLIHPIWLMTMNYLRTTFWYYSDVDLAYYIVGNQITAYTIAFIGWLMIEKPLMNIETSLFTHKR